MFDFKKLSYDDFNEIKEILYNSNNQSCDFSTANLFMWGEFYDLSYCITDGHLITRIIKNGEYYYSFPLGADKPNGIINNLIRYTNNSLRFYSLNISQLAFLNSNFPDCFSFITSDYGREYVYLSENLSNLPGRKYHQKKNFINRFIKNHSQIHIRQICDYDDIEICKSISDAWFRDKYADAEENIFEKKALKTAYDNYFSLDLHGIILYADGLPVAFAIGEVMNSSMFVIHYEKTMPEYKDAYPVINKEFAKTLTDYLYINREDDAGSDNLRKAKLSYHPDLFVYKYDAVYDDKNSIKDKISQLKLLWQNAFCDEEKIINAFFENVYPESINFNIFIDSKCASACYLLPCTVRKDNKVYSGYYLYAAASDENFQNRGIMTALLRTVIEYASHSDFLILYPANENLKKYYERIGFRSIIPVRNMNPDNISPVESVDEYAVMVDENCFVCYSNKVYRYYSYYYDYNECIHFSSGLGIIYNSSIKAEEIIIKDTL